MQNFGNISLFLLLNISCTNSILVSTAHSIGIIASILRGIKMIYGVYNVICPWNQLLCSMIEAKPTESFIKETGVSA